MLDIQQIPGYKSVFSPGKILSLGFIYIYQALALLFFGIMGWVGLNWYRLANAPLNHVSFFTIPFLVGLIYLAIALWALSLRRTDPIVQTFSLLSTSVALAFAAWIDFITIQIAIPVWALALGTACGTMISLGMLYPQRLNVMYHHAWLRWIGPVIGILLVLSGLYRYYSSGILASGLAFWHVEFLATAIVAAAFLTLMAFRWRMAISPIARHQARLIFMGGLMAFSPLVIGLIPQWRHFESALTNYFVLPAVLFPLFTAYAIFRHRIPRLNKIFSAWLSYSILTVLVATAYVMAVTGAGLVFGHTLPANQPLLIGFFIAFLAITFIPIRNRLQRLVDRLIFRSHTTSSEELQTFSRQLTHITSMPAVVELIRSTIDNSLNPGVLHIFLFDTSEGGYIACAGSDGQATSDLRFSENSPFVRLLSSRGSTPVFMRMDDTLPAPLIAERIRLSLLNAQLLIPLSGRTRLNGWLALGARQSDDPYSIQELNFLESIADQAALAVERAQVVADLERRIHEMDVLARITQGINITLNFDDILELIYTQTNRLIPSRDFAITLTEAQNKILYHAFFLQDDERINKMEYRPLPEGLGLESEILRTGRPLIVDDYERECRSRGVLPALSGIFAWIGVPLNSGAETIGIFSMGSREPAFVYSSEQTRILQAIADQAAGAIVKARLLEETEQRARQLKTLNDISRVLGSTLDIDLLLERILSSAVDILACQAGTLFLVDEQTKELIFRVTVGPVAADLVGQRLPPGTGLVGKAVELRAPVVANDVLRSKDWFAQPDEKTGFRTESLLVSPMIVKEQVIGVIEVINKQDGMPFIDQDQELLAAFAAQAAVAYENARLYTLTDQALADKVEELSVMQRIDRELNASLDIQRAMRITLEWAQRQSGADAGLIGMLQKDGSIEIMAYQGYPGELEPFLEKYVIESFPAIQRAIQSGQPQATSSSSDNISRSLLEGGHSQVVVPIRRETVVIGLLVLESHMPTLGSKEIQSFLARLSDHAAIAIANAHLYNDVQQANQAKSDFVSMVSHELKTPMTSIRGYTDLLLAGAVGAVTEAQANFLNTIRSNVDRMQILVSDLTDVARIEAGRLRLEYSSESIAEIIDEVVLSSRAQITAKGQKLHIELPDGLPAVWGDRGRLIQILANLVSNAHKYSPEGSSITLRAERTENKWDQMGAPDVIHISVEDTGFGISIADQKKIFQKFFRAEDQEVRNVPGTGLGLNITRYLVEIQGGKIWFESEYRKGTTFHFTIPVADEE